MLTLVRDRCSPHCKEQTMEGWKIGTEVSRCFESGNGEDQNRPWVPFCWETVLNDKSNKKTERCCSLIRDLTRHFRCLKRLHFHEAEIREQNGLGSSRFTTKGPPQ